MLVMTAPFPPLSDTQVVPRVEAAPQTVPAPDREPSALRAALSRCRTRYRLYRLCGWTRTRAMLTVLTRTR